jgi:UDP-2,3-diacylglucosamine pyrophosphatase LpxH
MAEPANLLIVSDLHFGEELLPGASVERRRAVELASTAFREFLQHHAARRLRGRPWRLVIAGDLFDFMSVVVPGTPELPARTADERRLGVQRGVRAGVVRMRMICDAHVGLLGDLVRFAAAGHTVDIVVGNHDVELLEPEVVAELQAHLRARGADDKILARLRVVPWFVYVPGVAWIEHGHVYDEGCSFEFNLSPCDPADGRLVHNADYAAVRHLGTALPDVDPHAIEEWSFWGFLRFGGQQGLRSFGRLMLGYARFIGAMVEARTLHQSYKRRDRRRREHRARLARVAAAGGLTLEQASAIDRLARTPLTVSWRRLGRMVMLDKFGIGLGVLLACVLLVLLLPLAWAFVGAAGVVAAAAGVHRWLGTHLVTSQLPMRAVPRRLRAQVDAPVVVFGHTHDPRWQPLADGGVYVNCGTWLPATRPGLRKSFTHVMIQPQATGGAPKVELRQWRDGASLPFAHEPEPAHAVPQPDPIAAAS